MPRTAAQDASPDQVPAPSAPPVEAPQANRGTKAIVAAFCANLGIAVAKFVGFLFTGSGSMLAESVHSVVDTGNQALLMLGGHRARKQADEQHPFGYGRERFFWAFMVAVVLFTLGAAFAIYDGVSKVLQPHEVDRIWWAIGILAIAMVLEGLSFRTALREARSQRGEHVRLWRYIRNAKAPEVPVVLLEDAAALTGLVLAMAAVLTAHLTGDARWDGYGTIGIGALLATVAVVLATEMKSLLIGESASPNQREAIAAALEIEPAVIRVIHVLTEHLGPEELLVGAKVEFLHDLTLPDVAEAVNRVEANVRANVPEARVMYIEPDVSRDRLPPPLVPEHTGGSPEDPTPPPPPRLTHRDEPTEPTERAADDETVALLEAQRRAAVAAAGGSTPPDRPDEPERVPWPARGEPHSDREDQDEDAGEDERKLDAVLAEAARTGGTGAVSSIDLDELLKPQQMPTQGTGARRRRRQADEPTQSVPKIEPPEVPAD